MTADESTARGRSWLRRVWPWRDRLSTLSWRSAAITAALLGTVLVSAAGAWAVRDSWLEHQRAVEITLDEYARYAARAFGREVTSENLQLRTLSMASVLGAPAHGEGSALTLERFAASVSGIMDHRVSLADDPDRGFFRVDPMSWRYEGLATASDSGVARELRRLVRSRWGDLDLNEVPLFSVVEVRGRPVSVIHALQRTEAGRPVAVYGYTISRVRSFEFLAAGVLRRTVLLPPSVPEPYRSTRGAFGVDTLVSLRLVEAGREVYHTPWQFASEASGAYAVPGTQVAFHATLHPSLVDRLRNDLLNDERRRLQFALPVLSILLAAVTILHLRREHELVRARRDFVASVSHELRTPLAQIRMFSETLLLRREEDEEERLRWIGVIGREACRLGDLVENILLFSHIDAARVRLEPERTDLGELVEEAVEAYVPMAEARRMRIIADAPSRIFAFVDPRALRQVVVNLLDNALKYGPAGQTVTVEVERDSVAARLTVSDQGPGVPAADRARLWRPFVRLGQGGTAGGSGIGLSVVRSLVTQHGGSVGVEDAPGGGARFVITLPLASSGPTPLPPVRMPTAEHAITYSATHRVPTSHTS